MPRLIPSGFGASKFAEQKIAPSAPCISVGRPRVDQEIEDLVVHMVDIKHRVVFGTREAVEQILAACGWKMHTAFVGRLTLDIWQGVIVIGP